MPRFFIDLRDQREVARDEEGAIYSHIEDALEEAKVRARDLARQCIDARVLLGTCCVEVRDVQSRTVATLTIAEVLAEPLPPAFKNDCTEAPKAAVAKYSGREY